MSVQLMDLFFALLLVVLGLTGIIITVFIIRNERARYDERPFEQDHPSQYDEYYEDKT